MLRVILKKGKSKPFWLGHPWVFSGAVEKVIGEAPSGGACLLEDERGNTVGWGHYNPHARIAVRLLTHRRSTDEDFEIPTFITFVEQQLLKAQAKRAQLGLPSSQTNAYRLVNAEGDGLSGLIVDLYADHAVMQLNSRAMDAESEAIAKVIMTVTGCATVRATVSQHGAKFEGIPPRTETYGKKRDDHQVEVMEGGTHYSVDLQQPQKTGLFLDQRDNRRHMATTCGGKTVLDLYSHAGGFGLHALKNGASKVSFVDSSEGAVSMIQRNLDLNDSADRGEVFRSDAMTFLKEAEAAGRTWDRIICDPPKFVRGRGHREDGIKKYARLNSLALSLLAPGGLMLTCSCSEHVNHEDFLRMLTEAGHRLRRSVNVHAMHGQAPDHPFASVAAQSNYLKAYLVSLD